MKKTFKLPVFAKLSVPLLALAAVLSQSGGALAATYAYNPADLISDGNFTNYTVMSESAIQTFLNDENSGLKSYKATEDCGPTNGAHYSFYAAHYHCGKSETAAQIIYDAAHAYQISPRAIMATMQKEEALITTPNPTSGALNCAMGYTDGYPQCDESPVWGFFYQVDNGTWQFRTDLDLMNNISFWGYDPSAYPCASATSLYNNGLYPGNTVTFANPHYSGDPYSTSKPKTITLVNSATAALYCYTPYVGPYTTTDGYSGTGYSGSFNFVISYEQWWGSTVYAYAGEVSSVQLYSDSARTQSLASMPTMTSGQTVYITVTAANTGSKTWSQSFTHVATADPHNRASSFADGSWLSDNRPAQLVESSVAPGASGTFQFSITAPSSDGSYNENFQLVADGQSSGWMEDSATFNLAITVSNPYNGVVTNLKTYRDSGYSEPTDIGAMTYGQKVYVLLQAKNTGNQSWSNSFTKIATESPRNRASSFADGTWSASDRPAAMQETSVAPGSTGTFKFTMTAPSSAGTYSETFGLVADGQSSGWMPSPVFTFSIKVVPPPLSSLYPGLVLYPGQSLASSNSTYHLYLQTDGNLVLYTPNQAIWASNTAGKAVSYMAMQTDGNLVLYTAAGRPVWASRTAGRGTSTLNLQNDGNLVIYTSGGKATWASGTEHNPSNTADHLSAGQSLKSGDMLMSPDGRYNLVLHSNGHLVLSYYKDEVWGRTSSNSPDLAMQGDGNLVLYAGGKAFWASDTNGKGTSTLDLQNDGNLVIYKVGGGATWASGTNGRT